MYLFDYKSIQYECKHYYLSTIYIIRMTSVKMAILLAYKRSMVYNHYKSVRNSQK